jgi:hypothetical protein
MNPFSVSVTSTGLNIPKSAALKILQTKKRSSNSLAFFLSKYLFVTANGNISNFLDGLNSILTYKNSKKMFPKTKSYSWEKIVSPTGKSSNF